ncbi:hypothetical protein GCM10023188_34720 [Pontibacter saemangeumensis]|uniref:Uncharacterized protein n=2 Tax=Pontibacter saemangeumensis TaxID=1084525 RepID=A0ABP8LYP1_9BACT
MAFDANTGQDRDLLNQAAKSLIGSGDHKVLLLHTTELYYSGRSLGWEMYSPYIGIGEPLNQKTLEKILFQVDYAIIKDPISKDLEQSLIVGGMYLKNSYAIYDGSAEKFDGITTNIWRLRYLYSIFEQHYGPYKIFVRKQNNSNGSNSSTVGS